MIRIGYIDGNVKVKGHGHITVKNIEVLHIEIVISILNQIVKFLSYFTT